MPRAHQALLTSLCLLSCVAGCEADPRAITLRLALPEALGCRPTEVSDLLLTPLGDFPSEERVTARVDIAGGITTIERFPAETELVAVRATGVTRTGADVAPWEGAGVALLGEASGELVVPLLRLRRSCPLADTRARVLPGAVTVALPDGRLLVAGGSDPARGPSPTVVTVRPGERLAHAGTQRLFVPRVGASATLLEDDLLLVAGGEGLALETFELLLVGEGMEDALDGDILARGRSGHGAARLADGRALLVGGRDAAGAPLRHAETVALTGAGEDRRASATATAGPPGRARAEPSVFVLDDATVLVMGGVDAEGPVSAIERFDPVREVFEPVSSFSGVRAQASFVALAGGRAARVGGLTEEGEWSREVDIVLDRGGVIHRLGPVLVPIETPVALGLPDGRLLVIGRDPIGRREVAQILDPGGTRSELERAAPPLDPSRLATRLVQLRDGTIAEADADGLSLLRLDAETPLDLSGARIFPVQTNAWHQLSLDVADRWRADGDLLVAVSEEGGRLTVPTARFAEVEVEVEVRGAVSLELSGDAGARASVDITEEGAHAGECGVSFERASLAEVRVRRTADALTIESDGRSAECPVALPGRVGVALRAALDAGIRRVTVNRL